MVPGPIGDLDSTTTVIYDVSGLAVRGCYLSFLDTNGQAISPGTSTNSAGWRLGDYTVGFATVQAPLAAIGQIQLTLGRSSAVTTEPDDGIASGHRAAKRGSVDPVAELLERGVDVNARGRNGQTPLHRAVRRGLRFLTGRTWCESDDPEFEAKKGQS